jgi:hypothetical protein
MQVSVAEFLEKVGKLKRTQEKVDALKANDSYVLRVVLQGAFDPSVKWLLPQGEPPYMENDLVDQEHILINEAKKLLYFVEGFHDLPSHKREMMFIELLERVDKRDAKLLCAIKEKRLPFNGITIQHVKEAFPGMIKDGQE